jgi:hypothetical protein
MSTTTGADLIDSEIEHPNNRRHPYRQLTASGEDEVNCDDEIRDHEGENNKAPVGDERDDAKSDSEPGPEKMSRDGMQCSKSESNQAQITRQSSSFNSEGDIETSATVASQEHATIDQGVIIVSQEERISNGDSSTDEAEEMLPNTDGLERAETRRHGCNVFPSISRSQEIYGDFSEIPTTRKESEDITQECGGQSRVAQLQQEYGVQEIGQQQTTQLYGTYRDADRQQSATVSSTTYGEDKGKHELISSSRKDCVSSVTTSSDTRQQWMSSSHFAQHSVSPVIFKHAAGFNQPSATTKSPRGSTGSKRTRTAYTSARLREMEQEFRNSNYFCRLRRVSLATMRNLSRCKMKIWFCNKKKKKKGEIQSETKLSVSQIQ